MIPVPQPVLDALARAMGTTGVQLTHFAGGGEPNDGVIYAFPHRNGRRLLKIMAFSDQDQERARFRFEERLRFVRYLGENGAPIAYPLLSPQERLYETHLSETHLWVGYCMDVAPGKTVQPNAWDERFFVSWGQTVGMLHRLAIEYPSWKASIDPRTSQETLTWREEWQGFYSWCQEEDVRARWVEIREQLEALPITREVHGFIHNDPHIWNLLVDRERITVLDFDVANHHWFVNDVAIACQSVLMAITGGLDRPVHDPDKLRAFLCLFMAGYAREYALPPGWLDHRLDLFIAYRRILLSIVMHGWISAKPSRHASWKEMIHTQPPVVGSLGL